MIKLDYFNNNTNYDFPLVVDIPKTIITGYDHLDNRSPMPFESNLLRRGTVVEITDIFMKHGERIIIPKRIY